MRLQINKVLATAIFFQLKYPQAHVIYRSSMVSLSCKSQMEKIALDFTFYHLFLEFRSIIIQT